jgi:amino acid transporter
MKTPLRAMVSPRPHRNKAWGEWLLMLSAVLSIGFGVLVFAFPAAGAVSIAWILGAYAAASVAVLVALGISLRSRRMAVPKRAESGSTEFYQVLRVERCRTWGTS